MKRILIITVLAAMLLLAVSCSRKKAYGEQFTVDVLNKYTPVKNQKDNPVCWAYAMLAAIETEHIMRGDSVNLSVDYAVRAALEESYNYSYLSRGARPVSMRGTSMRLIDLIMARGIVAYDAYRCHDDVSVPVIARKVERIALSAANSGAGLERGRRLADQLLDESLGYKPQRVFMLGAEYTPQEFARSVCAPDEYVTLTSFTHHPFFTSFELEVPDNVSHDLFYNVPIDTLMERMVSAVRGGRGVCWEGDISEPGFSFKLGVARLPERTKVTQASRQRDFERFATTDDHCMAVVGLAHDSRGRRFFIMKNSWGTANPYGGLMYVAEDYVRLKTVAVVMSHGQ